MQRKKLYKDNSSLTTVGLLTTINWDFFSSERLPLIGCWPVLTNRWFFPNAFSFLFLIKPMTLELIFRINSDYRVDIHIWGSKWPKNYKMFYNLEYIFASEYFYSYNYLELKRKIIYIWCKTNNRKYFRAHFKYCNQIYDKESIF